MRFIKHNMKQYGMAAVVGVCLIAIAGCSGRKSEQYRREADTLLQLGKVTEAAAAYQRAVEVNPRNALAKAGKGRCLLAQQKPDDALVEFRGAIETDPFAEPAYQEAIRLLVGRGGVEEALMMARKLGLNNPERGGILEAYILRESGKAAEATAHLRELRDQFPKSVDVRVNLASAHLAANQKGDAEAELQTILKELDSGSIAARMGLIDIYQSQGKMLEAVAEFEGLVKERPNDSGLKLALARTLLEAGRAGEAEKIARAVYEEQPESGWANHVLGSCLLARRQYSEALTYLQKAANVLPQQSEIARKLALARAGGRIQEIRPGQGETPVAAVTSEQNIRDWRDLWKMAEIRSLLQRRNEFLAKKDPNVTETLTFAAVLTGNMPLAQELAKELPSESPLIGYLKALEGRKLEEMLEFMKQWTETEPERVVLRENALAVGLSVMGGHAHAVQILSKCRSSHPDYCVSLYTLAQVFRAAHMPQFAAGCLGLLVGQAPENMEAHTLLFTVLREGDMLEEARKASETTYSMLPTSPNAILNLTQSYLDFGQADLAMKAVNRGIAALPNDQTLQIALARVLLHAGKPEEALDIIARATPSAEFSDQRLTIEMFSAAGLNQWSKVVELGQGLPKESPNPSLRLLLVSAYIQTSQIPKAGEVFSEGPKGVQPQNRAEAILFAALDKAPQTLREEDDALGKMLAQKPEALSQYAYGLACLGVQLHGTALTALTQAHDQIGGSPILAELMLRAMTRAIPREAREERAKALAEKYNSSTAVWLALADVYGSLKDTSARQKAVEKALTVDPREPEAWRQKAVLAEAQFDLNEAAKAYERILMLLPDDIMANNNLAYCLLMTGGDLDEALIRAENALKKKPSDPQIMHTLGVVQLRKGDLEKSDKNLRLAMEMRPGDPTVLLDLGYLLIAQNHTEEGKSYVQLALRYSEQLGLEFPRRLEAEKIAAGK